MRWRPALSKNIKSNKRNKENVKSIFSYKDRIKRKCLRCEKIFMSDGAWNRICISCKRLPEF